MILAALLLTTVIRWADEAAQNPVYWSTKITSRVLPQDPLIAKKARRPLPLDVCAVDGQLRRVDRVRFGQPEHEEWRRISASR